MSLNVLPRDLQDEFISLSAELDAIPEPLNHGQVIRTERKVRRIAQASIIGLGLVVSLVVLVLSLVLGWDPSTPWVVAAGMGILCPAVAFSDHPTDSFAFNYVERMEKKRNKRLGEAEDALVEWWGKVRSALQDAGFDNMRTVMSRDYGVWKLRVYLVGGAVDGEQVVPLVADGAVWLLLASTGDPVVAPYQDGSSVYFTDDRGVRMKLPSTTLDIINEDAKKTGVSV